MPDIHINKEYMASLVADVERWMGFLNNTIGFFSLQLALSCLGTRAPSFFAWICLFVIGFIRHNGEYLFPKEILRLRQLQKTDPAAQLLLAGINKRVFGLKAALTKAPVFLVGFVLLMAVALSFFWLPLIPSIAGYLR